MIIIKHKYMYNEMCLALDTYLHMMVIKETPY